MKKFMKNCAITALILIGAGFLLTLAAGSAKGAATIRDVVNSVSGGRIQLDLTDLGIWGKQFTEGAEELTEEMIGELEDKVDYDIEESMIFDDAFELFTGDAELDFADSEIKELDVEVGGCNFVVEESGDDNFYVEASGTKKFQGYVKNQTLYIKGTTKTTVGSDFDGEILLKIPAGFRFEKLNMEIGAGVMELGNLSAGKMELEVGAGRITADTLEADTLNVAVGMGEIAIEDMQVKELDAETGMGAFRGEGTVSEKVIIECAMGSAELMLEGNEKDYDYNIECGMGNVNIGGNTYSGLANEKSINNDADRKMDVECAVGSIEILFAED